MGSGTTELSGLGANLRVVALVMADGVPSFVPLLTITVLAALAPLISGRLRALAVPVVVGEIAIGILMGESGLGVIRENSYVEFLASLGFVYLMFLSGLEVDFSNVLHTHRSARSGAFGNPIVLSFAVFLGTVLLALVVSLSLGVTGAVKNPLIMALVLSTTSVGVVLPVLKDAGLTKKAFGQSLLLSALVADLSTMILITAAVTAVSGGVTPELLLILTLFVAFLGVWRMGTALRASRVGGAVTAPRAAAAEIHVRLALALMIFFVVLSQWIGAEIILGAFLPGAAISLISRHQSQALEEKLSAIGFGFLIPVFFIYTGANFDLGQLTGSPRDLLLVPVLVAAAYAVKVLPSLLYARTYGWRSALAAGILLSSRLSLIIAAAAIGVQVGAVSGSVAAAVILVAAFTCTLSSILFSMICGRSGRHVDG
jgi:Kef-type K+ transport system membrane component KefB